MEKRWLGSNYISQEGNEIIKKALCHYKIRLGNITQDRTVIEFGASFVGLFDQEAQRTLKSVNDIISAVEGGNPDQITQLESQIPILEKALNCLKYDISKQEQLISENNSDANSELAKLKDNLPEIEKALYNIKQYS